MTDQEKIESIKEILCRWALSNNCSGVDACAEIMEVLDFDPYPNEES